MTFGVELHRLRLESGRTLREVADRVGLSGVYLSDIERSRRQPPNDDTVRRISEAIGLADAMPLRLLAVRERGEIRVTAAVSDETLAAILEATQ